MLQPMHESDAAGQTVTLGQAKALIKAMAHRQSLLLLSPPGLGKTETVQTAARECGLECRSLLGTQIAPEDVSGVPRIIGERSVFCPPRLLLPEGPSRPFLLFLDELPACNPDIQKAFYSLLLERRIGEFSLPEGTMVVAAGNRAEDRALVRTMSSALVNRVTILQVRLDRAEWLRWAVASGVRREVRAFIHFTPDALSRPAAGGPNPFSTPRAWAGLSEAMDLAEAAGILDHSLVRALAFGRVSPEDAAVFSELYNHNLWELGEPAGFIRDPGSLPKERVKLWFILDRVRRAVLDRSLAGAVSPDEVNRFLEAVPLEHRMTLMVDLLEGWADLGANPTLLQTLGEVTGLWS